MTAEPTHAENLTADQALQRAEAISRWGAELTFAHERLHAAVRRRARVLSREQALNRFAKLPVAELREFAKGLRLGKLERAGYDTVGRIREASHEQLLEVPGVGEQTVDEAKDAADVLAGKIDFDKPFQFDPDVPDPRQSQLLAMVAAQRSTRSAVRALAEPVKRYEERVDPLLPLARKAIRRWPMLWPGRRKKEALSTLVDLVNEHETKSLAFRLQEALHRADPANYEADHLQRRYESDAAGFNTALANVTGAGAANSDEFEDFISGELRQKIEALPFDASLLKSNLRVYQLFGAKFVIHQERAIIGDEMGLGKTIQSLAVCAHLAAKGQERFLVVCPASVQANWIAEIERHTYLSSFGLHGAGREEQGRRWLREGGVAVTTFSTLDRLGFLKTYDDIEPALLIVDEAHYIKNPQARRSAAIREAIARGQRTLFLTGTPMENKVEEFQNLVSYVRPDIADQMEDDEAITGAAAFRRLVAPVYLRRNQDDVLAELPDKIEVEDWVQLGDIELETYKSAVKARNLMAMRREASAMPDTAKMERLVELVGEAIAGNRKVIVFSYFLDVLEAVEERLGNVVEGTITGKVNVKTRQYFVDQFSRFQGPRVLLAQIEAGGVGLNIQAASIVILAEPQWKPAIEQQAIARAHRMGQVRKVQVHRLLAKGSVDERIREIQDDKSLLFDHFARQSDAKDTNGMAVDAEYALPAALDDTSIPLERRVVVAERIRLGI